MQLAYESSSAAGMGLESKVAVPGPYAVPEGPADPPFAHSLRFDSAFESGNLLRAVQRGEAEYDLFLRADLHTTGYTQWFYFAVTDTHPPHVVEQCRKRRARVSSRVTFNIVNLTKPDSLFNQGMRPVMYSYHDAELLKLGWCRIGSDIAYRANQYTRQGTTGPEGGGSLASFPYYTLTFTIDFHNPGDVYLVAHSYPYTFSDHKV
jgi:hypothetical protein